MATIAPHPGQQAKFLGSGADIVVFGGAAGGGKSYGLLIEPLRHARKPGFNALILRRTYPEIRAPGSLWDQATEVYGPLGAAPKLIDLSWTFPSGAKISFGHLDSSRDLLKFQGREICLIAFDEATHFDESSFWFLLSRNRSTCGVTPYVRATCNPNADHWLADFISWWIDPETGYPVPERDGRVRWMARVNGELRWANSREEIREEHGVEPKSVSFIHSKLTDNPTLMDANPEYMTNLQSLPKVERERLLEGNWLIRDSEGAEWPGHCFGKHLWLPGGEFPDIPLLKVCSLDPSKGKEQKKGDYSAMVCAGISEDLVYVDCDLARRNPTAITEDFFQFCGKHQPHAVAIEANMMQSLFVDLFLEYARKFPGMWLSQWLRHNTIIEIENKLKKEIRIRRLSRWITSHQLRFTDRPGSRMTVGQLRQFPLGEHDDGPDALDMAIQTGLEIFDTPAEKVAGILG